LESPTEDLLPKIEEAFKNLGAQIDISKRGLIILKVALQDLANAIKTIVEQLGISHLSTMTGLDLGENIDVLYHFWKGDLIASVRVSVPKSNKHAPSIVGIVPGAILYEMEVHDMFGVTFDGNPWMDRRLLLPDNYPTDLPPPLLKETKPSEIRKAVGVER
jgi:NADH:ubiquinone oxidoreductase subunit C